MAMCKRCIRTGVNDVPGLNTPSEPGFPAWPRPTTSPPTKSSSGLFENKDEDTRTILIGGDMSHARRRGKPRLGRSLTYPRVTAQEFLGGRGTRQDDTGSPGSDGASPYQTDSAAERRGRRSIIFRLLSP